MLLCVCSLVRRLWTPTDHGGVQQTWARNPTSLEMMVVRMVVDYQNGVQKIFLDGALMDEQAITMTTMGPGQISEAQVSERYTGPYLIGMQSKSDRQSGRFVKIDLAEIVVWDTLLTDAESGTLLNNLRAKYCIE